MNIVTLTDYYPIPRVDGVPWTHARIEEAPTFDTPDNDWTEVTVVNLNPLDTDPKHPLPRDFTFEATIDNGWYRVVFLDATNKTMAPTTPVQNAPEESLPYRPSASDVAALLRARTKDVNGNELGMFTDKTRPNAEEVDELIQQATDDVVSETDEDIPEEAWPLMSSVIALGAAMRIELSYFPELVGTINSPYDRYKDLYDQQLARLKAAVEREAFEEEEGEMSEAGVKYFFPPISVDWDRVIW